MESHPATLKIVRIVLVVRVLRLSSDQRDIARA
jgi:hypothetical protein